MLLGADSPVFTKAPGGSPVKTAEGGNSQWREPIYAKEDSMFGPMF